MFYPELGSSKSPNSIPEVVFEDAFKTLVVDIEHPMKQRRKMEQLISDPRFDSMLMNVESDLKAQADSASDIL